MRSLLAILLFPMFFLQGLWRDNSNDISYQFYSDHTGEVCDSIEGDTITKWYVNGDYLVLENHLLWNDTDSFTIKPLSEDSILIGGYVFIRAKKNLFSKIEH